MSRQSTAPSAIIECEPVLSNWATFTSPQFLCCFRVWSIELALRWTTIECRFLGHTAEEWMNPLTPHYSTKCMGTCVVVNLIKCWPNSWNIFTCCMVLQYELTTMILWIEYGYGLIKTRQTLYKSPSHIYCTNRIPRSIWGDHNHGQYTSMHKFKLITRQAQQGSLNNTL